MKPNKPFTVISDRIIFDTSLSPTDKFVYITICQPAFGKKVFSFPSQERVAFLCHISVDTVQKSINRLVLFEYLTKQRTGKQKNNTYILNRFSTDNVQKQIVETEKIWKIRSAEIQDNIKKKLNNQKSDTPQMRGHSNTTETSDVVNAKSDVANERSDTSFEGCSDTASQAPKAVQYKAEQKVEASQDLEPSFDAPLRSASESKNDSVALFDNLLNKADNKDSVQSEAQSKDKSKDSASSEASDEDSALNMDVSFKANSGRAPDISVATKDADRDCLLNRLLKKGVPDDMIEKCKILGAPAFSKKYPQYASIVFEAVMEG